MSPEIARYETDTVEAQDATASDARTHEAHAAPEDDATETSGQDDEAEAIAYA